MNDYNNTKQVGKMTLNGLEKHDEIGRKALDEKFHSTSAL